MVKGGVNDIETKTNVVNEAITYPIATIKKDTVNKTDIPQAYRRKKDKSISN